MMQQAVYDTMAKRRDAAIKSILRFKELEVDSHLSPEVSQRLRKTVLDEINEYHSLCMELLKAYEGSGVIVNDLWIEKLEKIYDAVVK